MYVKRELESKIESFIDDKEIIAIIGPRQAGKTTLVNNILDKQKNKKINKITFENLSLVSLFEENIEAFIEQEIKGYDIVFIDEVQYVKTSGQKLKYIYDTINVKLIISGSSATELSLNSVQYLVGRILIFSLHSLSFEEFLQFRDEKLYNIYKKKLFSKEIYDKINTYIEEYILFGGYPRVVTEKDKEKKKEILKNIFNTYLLKEISEILQFKEHRVIEKLVYFVSTQISGVINYEDLSQKVGTTQYEIKNALSILEKTFICSFSTNYHTNKQTELVKSPKVFFYDTGLRNSIINLYEKELIQGDLYENFIASQLLRKEIPLKYWRTKSGAEIDFIIEKSNKLIGLEVKSYLKSNIVEKSIKSFIEKYSPSKVYITSFDFKEKRNFENTLLYFLPYCELLQENLK